MNKVYNVFSKYKINYMLSINVRYTCGKITSVSEKFMSFDNKSYGIFFLFLIDFNAYLFIRVHIELSLVLRFLVNSNC